MQTSMILQLPVMLRMRLLAVDILKSQLTTESTNKMAIKMTFENLYQHLSVLFHFLLLL